LEVISIRTLDTDQIETSNLDQIRLAGGLRSPGAVVSAI